VLLFQLAGAQRGRLVDQAVVSNLRGPATLADLVAELGPQARAATPAEAARAGDLVVAAIPMRAYAQLPADALAGRVVLDTMNYYPERDGAIAELDDAISTSSELELLARPAGAPDRSALPIAGDAAAAKARAAELLDLLGFDAVDTGDLAGSWRSEPGTDVYVKAYTPARPEGLSSEELQQWFFTDPGVTVPAARGREPVANATRIPPSEARMTLG